MLDLGNNVMLRAAKRDFTLVRKRQSNAGKEYFETLGHYATIPEALTAAQKRWQLDALSDGTIQLQELMARFETFSRLFMEKIYLLLEMAWSHVDTQWKALEIEGVSENPRTWPTGTAAKITNNLGDDDEVMSVLSRILVLKEFEGLLKDHFPKEDLGHGPKKSVGLGHY